MNHTMYQVDAFTDQLFGGNPAAVVILKQWLPDALMQKIALENNLSETAFLCQQGYGYHIRWFTPNSEVDLCGHATLASAHILFEHLNAEQFEIRFESRSGELSVKRESDWYTLDFPTDQIQASPITDDVIAVLGGVRPQACFQGKDDCLLILDSQAAVENILPDLVEIRRHDRRGFIVSAPGDEVDFVSRCFYPAYGIDEDPVTGSAHTSMAPYWADQLGKLELTARQLSARGGFLKCRQLGNRTEISGQAVTYMEGTFRIS
ncbi:MAG: PhzF family phenazine biosynthesis protein [Bacteroidota bacterium]